MHILSTETRGFAPRTPDSCEKDKICMCHARQDPACLSGTGVSQRDSRESIRANHSQLKTPIFIARQADSPESLEFPIRANHPIRANQSQLTPVFL